MGNSCLMPFFLPSLHPKPSPFASPPPFPPRRNLPSRGGIDQPQSHQVLEDHRLRRTVEGGTVEGGRGAMLQWPWSLADRKSWHLAPPSSVHQVWTMVPGDPDLLGFLPESCSLRRAFALFVRFNSSAAHTLSGVFVQTSLRQVR